jgi:hypothetical protein
MGIASHVWGASSAADQVWAQVAGLAPGRADNRLLLMLQAYIDESYNDEKRGAFVLAGCIATAEAWAAFSSEWARLVPKFGTLNKDSVYHFHMKEMAENAERLQRVPVFFRAIEDHVLGFVSASLSMRDLERAKSRIRVYPAIDWHRFTNPYMLVFSMLMDRFHTARAGGALKDPTLAGDSKIDFFFDERREKTQILASWDSYMQTVPDSTRRLFGSCPTFRSDADFLPLQAADFWAWWVRKWTDDGVFEQRMRDCDFGQFKKRPDRNYFRVGMAATEDLIVSHLKTVIKRNYRLGYGTQLWDVRLV